jgi:hypothetical protein
MAECELHGWYPDDEWDCPHCQEESLITSAAPPEIVIPASEGKLEITDEDLALGDAEFEHLITHGPDGFGVGNPFLRVEIEDQERARGLCRWNVLELAEAIAVRCATFDLEDFHRTVRKSLCVLLANIANRVNNERKFAYFARTGTPYWFGTHDMIFAPSGRGKGVALAFFSSLVRGAVHVEDTVGRFTLPGFFGGVDQDKKGNKTPVMGTLRRSDHGVILMPEFGDIRTLFRRDEAAIGVFAEWLSSGKVRWDLLKGHDEYDSFAYVMAACQPQMWDEINDEVTNLGRRFTFSELHFRTAAEEEAYLRDMEEKGFPLDTVALAVLAAKIKRIRFELKPSAFDPRQIGHWIADHITPRDEAGNPIPTEGSEAYFTSVQAQPYVALAIGYHLATDGNLEGPLVLPDPYDHPILQEILDRDAHVRYRYSFPEGDRITNDVHEAIRRGVWFGTQDQPLSHTTTEVLQFIGKTLQVRPSTARLVFHGWQPRDGSRKGYSGLTGDEGMAPILVENEEPVNMSEIRERNKRSRGRPEKIWHYNWDYYGGKP